MNVKIIRVLNTNAVVSVDSQGRELIMTGPGIGFKKRKGENIDQSLVDKTYHLENKEESKSFGGVGIAQRCLRGFFCRFSLKKKISRTRRPG